MDLYPNPHAITVVCSECPNDSLSISVVSGGEYALTVACMGEELTVYLTHDAARAVAHYFLTEADTNA